jgi:hypothetical protein
VSARASGIRVAAWPSKENETNDRLVRWRVSLITKTPAKFIDFTLAPDAATAEKQVAEAHDMTASRRYWPDQERQ